MMPSQDIETEFNWNMESVLQFLTVNDPLCVNKIKNKLVEQKQHWSYLQ